MFPSDDLRCSTRAWGPATWTTACFMVLVWILSGCGETATQSCASDDAYTDSEMGVDSSGLIYCKTGYKWCACNDYLRIASGDILGPVRELPGSRRAILNCSGNYWTTFTEKGELAPPTEIEAASIFYSDPECSSGLVIDYYHMESVNNHSDFILALPAVFVQDLGSLRCPDFDREFDSSKPVYRRSVDRHGTAQCTKAFAKAADLSWPVRLVPCPAEVLAQPLGPNVEALKLCKNPCKL